MMGGRLFDTFLFTSERFLSRSRSPSASEVHCPQWGRVAASETRERFGRLRHGIPIAAVSARALSIGREGEREKGQFVV